MTEAAQIPEQLPIIPAVGSKSAVHIGDSDLPFVDAGGGTHIQVLQVDLNQGLWILKTRFEPGCTIQKHFHTGSVFAVTLKGQWYYKEQPDVVNSPGSYLFEPAGSLHTLTVPEDQEGETEIWFAIYGANVNLDEDGNVTSLTEAAGVLQAYKDLCAANGHPEPNVIVMGEGH